MLHHITAEQPQIWLASGSPRRRMLLSQVGLQPIVKVANIEEIPHHNERPDAYVSRMAREKGEAVRAKLSQTQAPFWIIAADTVVVLDGQTLEKPADDEEARDTLSRLSGRAHHVMTGCWIADNFSASSAQHVASFVNITRVQFRVLSSDEVASYVATKEPLDKAGSYGIQGVAGAFVTAIEGSYSNVVGLPIAQVIMALTRDLGALQGFPFADKLAP